MDARRSIDMINLHGSPPLATLYDKHVAFKIIK